MRASSLIAVLLAGCSYESLLGRTPADASSLDVELLDAAGAPWSRRDYIKASNTGVGDGFGWSVVLSGDGSTLAVSALNEGSAATGIDGDQRDDSAERAGAVYVFVRSGAAWRQQAYLKASNTGADDRFGSHMTLSADGSILAVNAPQEDGAATGIDGGQGDGATDAGAVYVFARSGAVWRQQAYVKASNTGADDHFGWSVALSGDGTILAVGAPFEDSRVDGNQADNSAESAGAVYVFARSGEVWSQQAYVKASNIAAGDNFGWGVALSGGGSTLIVGAPFEDSGATGIGGDQTSNSVSSSGAVYVFERSGATWAPQAYVKASNTGSGDRFGEYFALSADGSTLAVGVPYEDSGVHGDQDDNSAESAGAAYVFARSGATWAQEAFLKASTIGAGDRFGRTVGLSADGSLLVAGASWEDSAATGVNGDAADDSALDAGAAYVFARVAGTWTQAAYLKATVTRPGDYFGDSIALSADGSTLAVGALQEDSAATGIGGNPADGSALDAGAVYVLH